MYDLISYISKFDDSLCSSFRQHTLGFEIINQTSDCSRRFETKFSSSISTQSNEFPFDFGGNPHNGCLLVPRSKVKDTFHILWPSRKGVIVSGAGRFSRPMGDQLREPFFLCLQGVLVQLLYCFLQFDLGL